MKLFHIIFLSLIFPSSGFAWNALGHMVIADIAYAQLSTNTKQKADDLAKKFHKAYPEVISFLAMSYWPDSLRAQKIDIFTHWHYIDNNFSLDGTPINHSRDTDNVVWAINHIKNKMQQDRFNVYFNASEQARFLAFLIHTVGDIHQPLHTASLFSIKHPYGDKGGNLYRVIYNGKRISLHQLWDTGLDIFNGKNTKDYAHALATTITTNYPPSFFGSQISNLLPEDWSKEGLEQAKKYAYVTAENKPLDAGYVKLGQQVVEQRAALAGYRLGVMLNQLLV